MVFNRFKSKKQDSPEGFVTKKEFEEVKKLVDTHQDFLNNLYIFHDFEPTPFLDEMRNLSYELMKFFDNVCRKYDLEYWIDYGTLLGALRHGDFIPWDDDLDVGMMRADYFKLIDIFQSEIDNNGLVNVDCAFKIDKRDKVSKRWFQINYRRPEFNGKFVGIDVFPYDFIENPDNVEENYYDSRAKFYKRRTDGLDIKEAVDELYSELNLNLDKDKFIISGVEGARGKVNIYKFAVMEYDEIFPLERVKFGKCELLIPNNPHDYVKKIYGERYMQIPSKIRDHGRLNRYRKQPTIMDMLEESNAMFKSVNENFEF